ncbi:hypothetical protein AA313_de0206232 [Arthrobotrys entomopaga]|nr:hypothetical protein AA313_de0206232 [Arthrobotrys entomopaga]
MLSKLKLSSFRRRSRQSLIVTPELLSTQSNCHFSGPSEYQTSEETGNELTITPGHSSPSLVSASTNLNDSGRASVSSQQFLPSVLLKPHSGLPEDSGSEELERPSLRRKIPAASQTTASQTSQTVSPLAPRILSISDGSWTFSPLLLVFGQCGQIDQPQDGTILVHHHHDNFPSTSWPVSDGYFRALIYLEPGPNKLRFEYVSSRTVTTANSQITIHMMPLAAPPLHLVILLGKDSTEKFDCPPDKIKSQGNGLDAAVKKFRMAALLWQAYTAEEMARNKFGRRTFKFEEIWATESISHRDKMPRALPKVHIVRSEKTVAEIRDLDIAQQNTQAKQRSGIWDIAYEAVEKYFAPRSAYDRKYVAVLILDSKWDVTSQTITGHAALGGGSGFIQMGIFGSHSLHAWPSFIEDVVSAFTDCTRTDTKIVANDAGESGSYWSLTQQEQSALVYGSFKGTIIQVPNNHPNSIIIKSASDPPFIFEADNPQVFGVDGAVVVVSLTGVAWVEIYINDILQSYFEIFPKRERSLIVSETDILQRITNIDKTRKIKLSVFTIGNGKADVDDFLGLTNSAIKLPGVGRAYQSFKLGLGGGLHTQVVLPVGTNKVLNAINIYFEFA